MSFLRRVLWADALSAGAMGAMVLVLAAPLAPLLGLPASLLSDAGLVLIPFALFVGFLALRSQPWRAGVWIVIVLNTIWVIDSIVLLTAGWAAPSALGYAFVIGQAVVVGVFAELEYVGLRRRAAAA
jgi:hypothetical protein